MTHINLKMDLKKKLMFRGERMKKGWDNCDWLIWDEFCCKDLDSGRVWVCEKGFPRLYGKYIKCMLKKGTKIKVCGNFKSIEGEI